MSYFPGVYTCTVIDTATGKVAHVFPGVTETQKQTRHCERFFDAFMGKPSGVYRYEYTPDPEGAAAMEKAQQNTQ